MSFDAAGRLLSLLSSGVDLDAACEQVSRDMLFQPPQVDVVLRFVQRDMPVAAIPDAKCVADRLRSKPNPTRADVDAAFRACTRH